MRSASKTRSVTKRGLSDAGTDPEVGLHQAGKRRRTLRRVHRHPGGCGADRGSTPPMTAAATWNIWPSVPAPTACSPPTVPPIWRKPWRRSTGIPGRCGPSSTPETGGRPPAGLREQRELAETSAGPPDRNWLRR